MYVLLREFLDMLLWSVFVPVTNDILLILLMYVLLRKFLDLSLELLLDVLLCLLLFLLLMIYC